MSDEVQRDMETSERLIRTYYKKVTELKDEMFDEPKVVDKIALISWAAVVFHHVEEVIDVLHRIRELGSQHDKEMMEIVLTSLIEQHLGKHKGTIKEYL